MLYRTPCTFFSGLTSLWFIPFLVSIAVASPLEFCCCLLRWTLLLKTKDDLENRCDVTDSFNRCALWCVCRCNTVHVADVVHAIWTACVEHRSGATYNLSDHDSCGEYQFFFSHYSSIFARFNIDLCCLFTTSANLCWFAQHRWFPCEFNLFARVSKRKKKTERDESVRCVSFKVTDENRRDHFPRA